MDDVDQLFAQFAQNGLDHSENFGHPAPIDQTWGTREFWLRDPDGNRITYGQTL